MFPRWESSQPFALDSKRDIKWHDRSICATSCPLSGTIGVIAPDKRTKLTCRNRFQRRSSTPSSKLWPDFRGAGPFLDKASAIDDPFERAFFALVQIPYLQPFVDVNKRVSRLAANLPLIRGNLCPLSFVDVPTQAYVDGLLGVYELNRVELLREVFCWAYERSCARYSVVRQSLGEPDPFRLKHRALIVETIRAVVEGGMDQKAAARHIRRRAAEALPAEEVDRFIELVETDLLNLHEGNIARARLTPTELESWKAGWRGGSARSTLSDSDT